jgi:hypothetical protein
MRSNALKKAETQARRRATLAMCGQGWAKPRRKSQPVQVPVKFSQQEKPELVLRQSSAELELERPTPQALKILDVK